MGANNYNQSSPTTHLERVREYWAVATVGQSPPPPLDRFVPQLQGYLPEAGGGVVSTGKGWMYIYREGPADVKSDYVTCPI
jgi:hypothetical protein